MLIINSKFLFAETYALVQLVDDEGIAIVPIARISAVTTSKKMQKEISESIVASKTRLPIPLSMMSIFASARVLLWAKLINYVFTSKLLWALEQDLKNYSPWAKL